jgi:hypothetical protein
MPKSDSSGKFELESIITYAIALGASSEGLPHANDPILLINPKQDKAAYIAEFQRAAKEAKAIVSSLSSTYNQYDKRLFMAGYQQILKGNMPLTPDPRS